MLRGSCSSRTSRRSSLGPTSAGRSLGVVKGVEEEGIRWGSSSVNNGWRADSLANPPRCGERRFRPHTQSLCSLRECRHVLDDIDKILRRHDLLQVGWHEGDVLPLTELDILRLDGMHNRVDVLELDFFGRVADEQAVDDLTVAVDDGPGFVVMRDGRLTDRGSTRTWPVWRVSCRSRRGWGRSHDRAR